jgi:hypothetical protein
MHVLNNGATTTSTETTVGGSVNKYATTETTEVSQEGSGNGKVVSQSTTTDTSATGHPVIRSQVNTHPSTTELAAVDTSSSEAPPVSDPQNICNGGSFHIRDAAKRVCLHVKGNIAADGTFAVSTTARMPVVTMPCNTASQNQIFTWAAGAHSGTITHVATGKVLAVPSADVVDGTAVLLADQMPNNEEGDDQQRWAWSDAADGGVIVSAANEAYQITDSKVNADANVGLPVHMWHLAASLPSGSPNAAWMASCNSQ